MCCRGACSAWLKLLKPPYVYSTHWHYVQKRALLLSKISPHKNDISQLTELTYVTLLLLVFWSTRSSRLQMFFKIGVLKDVSIFTEKHLCRSLFNKLAGLQLWILLKKRLQHRCFPVSTAEFLRTTFMKHLQWLLLKYYQTNVVLMEPTPL